MVHTYMYVMYMYVRMWIGLYMYTAHEYTRILTNQRNSLMHTHTHTVWMLTRLFHQKQLIANHQIIRIPYSHSYQDWIVKSAAKYILYSPSAFPSHTRSLWHTTSATCILADFKSTCIKNLYVHVCASSVAINSNVYNTNCVNPLSIASVSK